MAKKKDKPQVINNIGELNLEIDYDKLAEAIVKAQNVSTIQEEDPEDEEMFVEKVVSGKIPKGKLFSQTLSKLLETFFYILAVVSVFISIRYGWEFVSYFFRTEWIGLGQIIENIFYILVLALLVFVEIYFVRIVCKIGSEIGREQDKNYIVSSFSCVVSLAALIVALVALFKGVG